MGHVGWIVVTAIAWFRGWDMWGGACMLQWLGSGCGTCGVEPAKGRLVAAVAVVLTTRGEVPTS